MDKSPITVPVELIEKAIYLNRGEKVMLDRDLAELYGVTTSALKQSVRRNSLRFPPDFMFVLDHREFDDWRSQIVISKADRKGLRYAPMAFTDKGRPRAGARVSQAARPSDEDCLSKPQWAGGWKEKTE